jgi:hypothetical protein
MKTTLEPAQLPNIPPPSFASIETWCGQDTVSNGVEPMGANANWKMVRMMSLLAASTGGVSAVLCLRV